jgi:hypothetical protein
MARFRTNTRPTPQTHQHTCEGFRQKTAKLINSMNAAGPKHSSMVCKNACIDPTTGPASCMGCGPGAAAAGAAAAAAVTMVRGRARACVARPKVCVCVRCQGSSFGGQRLAVHVCSINAAAAAAIGHLPELMTSKRATSDAEGIAFGRTYVPNG